MKLTRRRLCVGLTSAQQDISAVWRTPTAYPTPGSVTETQTALMVQMIFFRGVQVVNIVRFRCFEYCRLPWELNIDVFILRGVCKLSKGEGSVN